LLIEVEDSGQGISAEDQERIFDPFVQLGEQRDNKGTGLGLTITRQFVHMMGGKIILESTVGKGSLFRVDLPLKEANERDIIKVDHGSHGSIIGLASGQPEYRILVVEDQLENQLLLQRLMESVGFKVKVAENGQKGVEAFQTWHPDLIWMDRKMPVMDGLEATRRIRALPGGKEVKIVAVTASAFQEQRAEMLAIGMDDFVRKPYRFNEIYDCLARQLGVQYVREDEPDKVIEEAISLAPEMLLSLPPELRQELASVLETLESDLIADAIRKVRDYDPKLEKVLARLANGFDYPAILTALQSLLADSATKETAPENS
jgi:CheY-like chemotaxis protein